MKTYIELWKAKQSWIDLAKEERGKYFEAIGPAIQQLLENGVKILSWGENETSTFNRIDYDFFAVWTFPDKEVAEKFEQMVEEAGWYNYFDQVNAMGTETSPQDVLGKMIEM